jgi:Uma2 family endonuclease
MRTVIVGQPPAEIEALIARRKQLGQDTFDEVWNGDYHMAPAPHPRHGMAMDELIALLRDPARARGLRGIAPINVGTQENYRVPDYAYYRSTPTETFVDHVEIVVEVVSPGDETYAKFDHYAAHRVGEIVCVDPIERSVRWFVLAPESASYDEVRRSPLVGVDVDALVAAIEWPDV